MRNEKKTCEHSPFFLSFSWMSSRQCFRYGPVVFVDTQGEKIRICYRPTKTTYNLGISLGLCGVYVHCGVVLNIPRPGSGSKTYSLLYLHNKKYIFNE